MKNMMRRRKYNQIGLLLAVLFVLPTACSTPAKISYLRDLEYNIPYEAISAPELRLKVDDRISIQVFSINAELAAPFNTGAGLSDGVGASPLTYTYGVDARGDIEFPVLGTLHVEGMTLNEVQKMIAGAIRSRGYIKDPVVKAELTNFTVTVLGETGQSVLSVPGQRINILELIARSGGTSAYSKLPDVMVVRTNGDERTAYTVDLQSKDLYLSPVFYLEQNDLVYVKPRGLRLSTDGDLFLKILTPVISAISAVAYMLLWTSR